MKQKICPQCHINRFQVKNSDGSASIVVTVNANNELVPIHQLESLMDFDTSTLYCLGCSWKGSIKALK